MPPAQRIIRGVKDIRTRTSLLNEVFVPYKAYMAITSLEMEKSRRQTERKSLLVRLNGIEERLKTIDKEKTVLLRRLGREKAERAVMGSLRSSLPAKHNPPGGRSGGFRYQY
ncbi:MAG: hypothetical protein Q7S40_09655 [Opitutaceae bacterium]|nr:hypothetical protein [Opitutaceae bacterium]